jgi:hypothetical protein
VCALLARGRVTDCFPKTGLCDTTVQARKHQSGDVWLDPPGPQLPPDPVREYALSVRLRKLKEGHNSMECPHCGSEFEGKSHVFALGEDPDGSWQVSNARCSVCDRLIVGLCTKDGCTYPVRPTTSTRPRLSDDVPAEYADDYHTASQIISYSPEASAAISRRSLHRFLATVVRAGHGGLADQIRQAGLAPEVPAYVKQALNKLATLAKLETDSVKSLRPESIAAVEPGEAKWLLDLLQSLFDLYFEQPARMQRKQDALEEELAPPAPPPPPTPPTPPAAVAPAAASPAAQPPAPGAGAETTAAADGTHVDTAED